MAQRPLKKKPTSVSLRKIDTYPQHLLRGFLRDTQQTYDYAEHLMYPSKIRFGAFKGEEPVGFICASNHPEHLKVPAVYVAYGHRREGIQKKMISRLIREAKQRGIDTIHLTDMSPVNQRFFDNESKSSKRKRLQFRTIKQDYGGIDGEIKIIG